MKPSTKRALSLLGTAAVFVAALLVYALLLRPAYREVNVARGELGARAQIFAEKSDARNLLHFFSLQMRGCHAHFPVELPVAPPLLRCNEGRPFRCLGCSRSNGADEIRHEVSRCGSAV